MTFLAALRYDRIDAPFLLDGPINKVNFIAYIEQVLAPTLRPGDVVVADNLGCHRSREVRAALRVVRARVVLLPKYSPDLNPIEQVCAMISALLHTYTPQECSNYLTNSGYDGRYVIPL